MTEYRIMNCFNFRIFNHDFILLRNQLYNKLIKFVKQ